MAESTPKTEEFTKAKMAEKIQTLANSPAKLRDWLNLYFPFIVGPSIQYFEPSFGPPGTLVTIHGSNFSPVNGENLVDIGGQPAYVVRASATELQVITGLMIKDGPVSVKVGRHVANGPQPFLVRGYPVARAGEDGPPVYFDGAGQGAQGDVNPIGTIRVLIALVTPNDLTPTAAARTTIDNAWKNVVTFYDQASYGKTTVKYDMTTNWKRIDASQADLLLDDNIDWGQMDRVVAFAAQGAVDEGFQLDNYAMMATVMFLNGVFIRAWGNWSRQSFTYTNGLPPGDPNAININLSASHPLSLIAIQETANWGRCAHEFGHNVVSAPNFLGDGSATLGEDVYSSGLVDPAAATAREFELMGSHDLHPLFSGYHLDKLTYYSPANIKLLQWDRNSFSKEFDVIAHGLTEDANLTRFHIIKIKIADGLHYYVEVRQRPGPTAQIFDDNIPLAGAPNQGGVIITSAIADVLQTNQQTRFITLLHPNHVLKKNDTVEDPARALKITVVDDNIQARPLVCRVRIEWAQTIADDPNGSFDLRVEPWDSNWQTPDIWIDRAPFGTFDNPLDTQGRPTGNGDRPMPGAINHFHTRVHVSGAMGASNVKVTFYAVFPPGVGDNGNWTPLDSKQIANIGQNSFSDVFCNWTPVVGQHTCLKVYANQQLGEISGGNNLAQENVFDFEAPANSPPAPVFIRTAIRNPIDERRMVQIGISGVPRGYRVHFPHSWMWIEPKAERHFDLVVIPILDYNTYKERKVPMMAPIRVTGWVSRQYDEPLAPSNQPAGSRCYPIGGTLNRVRVVKLAKIDLKEDRDGQQKEKPIILLRGHITPALAKQRVRVDLINPLGALRVMDTVTDNAGGFSVAFDLLFEPSLESDPKKWEKAKEIQHGIYRAQARIVASDALSSAESSKVFIKK